VEDTDALAISRSLSDPETFEAVFDRHFAAIHRYLRRRVGTELAQELASETFCQAFRSRGRFAPGCDSALPWLYGIAANLLRMNQRAEERRLRAYARAVREREGLTIAVGARESRIENVDARLDAAALAQALGVSPAAVRTRLHRARAQVGELLGDVVGERRTRA
jgi:RNA polymerase sigma-70 factor, ECF subfamily